MTAPEAERLSVILGDIGRTSRGLIDALNDIVWAVDPKNDSFDVLLLRIKNHAARVLEAKGINYEIEIPEELSALNLPLGFRRRLFLIFKEAVNNVLRHAQPTRVVLRMERAGRQLVMTVSDNGVGFDPDTVARGNGLRNMEERAASLGGSLSVASSRAAGTAITLRAPIP
jgi:signal transduction histidine kinase